MLTYSVAIRTLARNPDTLRRVLESVASQTLRPEKTVVYIGEDHTPPSFRVADEIYVTVPKGMMSQRVLGYDEISSDCILMLDDDIQLSPGTSLRLLTAMERDGYVLLGADMFRNHLQPVSTKLKAVIANLIFPHQRIGRGFILHPEGSFSYPAHPSRGILPSDTCGGPLMLWHRKTFLGLHFTDELWLEELGYPYGEDALISYKAKANGLKVGVDFGAEVTNLDSQTASSIYHADPRRHYIRSKAMTMAWWRMNFRPDGKTSSTKALVCGLFKATWLAGVTATLSLAALSATPFTSTLRGIRDGIREAQNLNIPPYILRD